MELEGAHDIPLPRSKVWAALNDPDVLRACIPGCKELTQTSNTSFSVRVVTKIGPVSAAFKGNVALSDVEPGQAYTIAGTGQGGVAGFAKGSARIALADADDGRATHLTYKAQADIGGKLASVGSRMLEGVARKTADQFFSTLVARLGDGASAAAGAPARGDGTAAPQSRRAAPAMPQAIDVRLGEVRVVHEASPGLAVTLAAAVAGWTIAALALARRSRD